MSENRNIPEHLLLDWHLDRLSGDERSWVEQELRSNAALRATSDQLRRVLQPLDSWQTPPASAQLADRVLSFVRRSRGDWDTSADWEAPTTRSRPKERAWPFFRLREGAAVAACLLLLAGVMVPGMSEVRFRSQKAVCANRLASVYRGLTAYQADFSGALPYAGQIQRASWLPTAELPFASNSRHTYLLGKLGFVTDMKDFLCPSTEEQEEVGRARERDDFTAGTLSFDTLNLAGDHPNVQPPPSVAYIADRNPLFVNGSFDESQDPSCANSPAHRGRGQTVLTLDGHAEFANTPLLGNSKDNVWLIDDVRSYTGTEVPVRRDDSFLVPGANSLPR